MQFVHVVASNACPGQPPIALNGSVEVAFDRLLLPSSVTRQTFVLKDKSGNFFVPQIAYDPVDRIVTLTNSAGSPFVDGQSYELDIATPSGPSDPNGLRAIDGVSLDPMAPVNCMPMQSKAALTFVAMASAAAPTAPPSVDFCKDIYPIFVGKCLSGACHGPGPAPQGPQEGLELDTPAAAAATALGLVAHEANTGSRAASSPPGRIFGVDMPIIDPGSGAPTGGDPGNSWMIYKMLMAVPATRVTTTPAMACDGGTATPTPVSAFHTVTPQPLSDPERSILSNLVPGREMPYPTLVGASLSMPQQQLSLDELERVSQWIAQTRAQGVALIPAMCPMCIP